MYAANALAHQLDQMKKPLEPLDKDDENGGEKKSLHAGDGNVQDSGIKGMHMEQRTVQSFVKGQRE